MLGLSCNIKMVEADASDCNDGCTTRLRSAEPPAGSGSAAVMEMRSRFDWQMEMRSGSEDGDEIGIRRRR
ncbi:hypothetical protein LINGRAHAP2_LOCUS15641 [Linum grandiflorum]